MSYKIDDTVTFNYDNPPVAPDKQYKIGQVVSIIDHGKEVARYKVTETNETTVTGVVVVTCGHSRKGAYAVKRV